MNTGVKSNKKFSNNNIFINLKAMDEDKWQVKETINRWR